jgi:hypothetical protein
MAERERKRSWPRIRSNRSKRSKPSATLVHVSDQTSRRCQYVGSGPTHADGGAVNPPASPQIFCCSARDDDMAVGVNARLGCWSRRTRTGVAPNSTRRTHGRGEGPRSRSRLRCRGLAFSPLLLCFQWAPPAPVVQPALPLTFAA